jgi:hypothetical protein
MRNLYLISNKAIFKLVNALQVTSKNDKAIK